jgi:outer membrane murein-binding lipoprotein Lpp
MTGFIIYIAVLLSVMLVPFIVLQLKIDKLETKVRDLELCRTQALNDIKYLKTHIWQLERKHGYEPDL